MVLALRLKLIDFLDFSRNLWNGTYILTKSQTIGRLLYIHSLSNQPPNVIEEILNSIQKRLSKNLSNKEIFNTAKCKYKDALRKSGFKVDFKYTKNQQKKLKNTSWNIIWFNPPLVQPNVAISTNVAIKFFFDWLIEIFHSLIDYMKF